MLYASIILGVSRDAEHSMLFRAARIPCLRRGRRLLLSLLPRAAASPQSVD